MTKKTGKPLPIIDFHIHIGLKEHWHDLADVAEKMYSNFMKISDSVDFNRHIRAYVN